MKKTYIKTIVALAFIFMASAVGFGTAYGYGGSASGGSSRPVVTFAPGRVLGESTTNWANLPAEEKAKIIKALQDQLAAIIQMLNQMIANGTIR